MSTRRLPVSAALLAVLSVAACANGGVPPGSAAPAVSATPAVSGTPAAVAPSESVAPSASAVPTSAAPAGPQTLSGVVAAGVEPNCLILGDKLLIFKDESLRAAARVGETVTVTGSDNTGMMTTCMQGTPFVVTSIR